MGEHWRGGLRGSPERLSEASLTELAALTAVERAPETMHLLMVNSLRHSLPWERDIIVKTN